MLSSKDDKKQSLPTIKQIAATGDLNLGNYYVTFIWFPGRFQQLTIQTPDFRIGLDSRTESVKQFIPELVDYIENGKCLKVVVSEINPLEWELKLDDDYECDWNWIGGDSGATCQDKIKAVIPSTANGANRKNRKKSPDA